MTTQTSSTSSLTPPSAASSAPFSGFNASEEALKKLIPAAITVWNYLNTGKHLSNLVAFNNLAVGSLTKRVSEIRRWLEEHDPRWVVTGVFRKDTAGKRYKSYSLTYNGEGEGV